MTDIITSAFSAAAQRRGGAYPDELKCPGTSQPRTALGRCPVCGQIVGGYTRAPQLAMRHRAPAWLLERDRG